MNIEPIDQEYLWYLRQIVKAVGVQRTLHALFLIGQEAGEPAGPPIRRRRKVGKGKPQKEAPELTQLLKQLKSYKLERHMTDTELAKRMGVSLSAMNLWIRGKYKPRPEYQEKIKNFLQGTDQ